MNDHSHSVLSPPEGEVDGATIANEAKAVAAKQKAKRATTAADFKINYVDFNHEDLSLHVFVLAVMKQLKPEQVVPAHRQIARQLRARFDAKTYRSLADYMQSGNPGYLKRLNSQTLRRFLTGFYSACCEVAGPVCTDRWFSQLQNELAAQDPHFDLAALQRLL